MLYTIQCLLQYYCTHRSTEDIHFLYFCLSNWFRQFPDFTSISGLQTHECVIIDHSASLHVYNYIRCARKLVFVSGTEMENSKPGWFRNRFLGSCRIAQSDRRNTLWKSSRVSERNDERSTLPLAIPKRHYTIPYMRRGIIVYVPTALFDDQLCVSSSGLMLSLLVAFSWATLPLMSLYSFLFRNPSTSFTRISMFSVMTGKDETARTEHVL